MVPLPTNSTTGQASPSAAPVATSGPPSIVELADLDRLIAALAHRGYQVVGPLRRDHAIVYDEISSVSDLPAGWTDVQDAGSYRLERRADGALFGHRPGPTSWKRFLFPPDLLLWRARRGAHGFALDRDPEPSPRYALLGVRACELAAIQIQDRVFQGSADWPRRRQGTPGDPDYRRRRDDAFLIAVDCNESGGTCFCASMGTGPALGAGYDLALTELVDDDRHRFLVRSGSVRGAEVLTDVPQRPAEANELAAAEGLCTQATVGQRRHLDTRGLAADLAANPEHPHWDDVARRCLACGNCTLACPTCFCHTVDDQLSLDGATAERTRRWDSCFSTEFSYIHGGSLRPSVQARYRQWLTHKLATWHDQFGSSGCVGCGRCITWCPAGIDLTVEAQAIRATLPGTEDPHADSRADHR